MIKETRVTRNRQRTVYKQVKLWRKRMTAYRTLKDALLEHLSAYMDDTTLLHWFNAPQGVLSGRRPKDLLNPKGIRRLHRLAFKQFKLDKDIIL